MNHSHQRNVEHIKSLCQSYLNQPVKVEVEGSTEYNGIIEQVDDDYVYLLVPVDDYGNMLNVKDVLTLEQTMQRDETENRQFYPPFYYNPYFYNPYFYPRPRYGWNRLVLPLAALTALAVLL